MMAKRLMIAAFMLASSAALSEPLKTVHVFSDDPVRVPHLPSIEITVYDLSEASYHKKNPLVIPARTVEEAQSIAKRIEGSPQYQQHIETIKQAYKPYQIMGEIGISRLPAIVFNKGTHVIYGTTDIAVAIDDYYAFIRKAGDQR